MRHFSQCIGGGKGRQRPVCDPVQDADIIQAGDVVGMSVGIQDGVYARNTTVQQLGSHIW